MEQVQFIIGLIVIAVILVVKARKAVKGISGDISDVPDSHMENFPFPTLSDQESIDEWLGKKPVSKEKSAILAAATPTSIEIKGDKTAVRSVKSQPKVAIVEQYEEFEFDAEKAVVYSEIMTPKFKEY